MGWTLGIRRGFQYLSLYFEGDMAIKCAGYDDELVVSNNFKRSNWNKHHVQMDFDNTIDYMTMVGMTVDLVRKMEEFFLKGSRKPRQVYRVL